LVGGDILVCKLLAQIFLFFVKIGESASEWAVATASHILYSVFTTIPSDLFQFYATTAADTLSKYH
jgi:ABC-type amino acid transport system permease subunit